MSHDCKERHNVGITLPNKPPMTSHDWEWSTSQLSMVIYWGWFMIVIPTLHQQKYSGNGLYPTIYRCINIYNYLFLSYPHSPHCHPSSLPSLPYARRSQAVAYAEYLASPDVSSALRQHAERWLLPEAAHPRWVPPEDGEFSGQKTGDPESSLATNTFRKKHLDHDGKIMCNQLMDLNEFQFQQKIPKNGVWWWFRRRSQQRS